MAIQVVHGGKFIKTAEKKKEMHDVPENLEMYFSRSKINFKVNLAAIIANIIRYITCHISTSYWVH